MYCKYCGHKLEEGAKFCTNCGARQEDDTTFEPTEESKYEPTVVAEETHEEEYDFGATVEPEQPKQEEQKADEPKKDDRSNAVAFGIISFLVPILGFILFAVWRKEYPERSKACLIGAIVAIAISVSISIIYRVAVGIGVIADNLSDAVLPLCLLK